MDSDLNNMSIAEALNVVSEQVIAKLALPSWVYRLPIKRSNAFTKLLRNDLLTLNYISGVSIMIIRVSRTSYTLHCRFKRIDAAYKQVAAVIDTLITQKIEEVSADGYDVQSEKGDVFTRLVHAHVNGEGSAKLTLDRNELVSFGVLFLLSFVRWASAKI